MKRKWLGLFNKKGVIKLHALCFIKINSNQVYTFLWITKGVGLDSKKNMI